MHQASKPRKLGRLRLAMLPAVLACGCASMNNTEKGVATGGVIGAGTGALIGNAVGKTGAGALIGTGIGALAGGLMGNSVDEAEKRTDAKLAAAAASRAQAPGLTDVVSMAQQHISDSVIISQIRSTGALYHLSPGDITFLKQNGVSDAVVMEMQATANRAPRRIYSPTPMYSQPVYVVEPAPPPVAIGVGYSRVWR